jgi:LysR family hydrogen peroxide-inducible transcriptional activator
MYTTIKKIEITRIFSPRQKHLNSRKLDIFLFILSGYYQLWGPTRPKDSIFLLQKEHCLTEHAVSACGLKHKEQVSSLTANSLHTLVSLVNSEMGYTFLPEMALRQNILVATDVLSLPAEDNAFRDIGLVWRNGTTRIQLFRYIGKIVAPLLPQPIDIM